MSPEYAKQVDHAKSIEPLFPILLINKKCSGKIGKAGCFACAMRMSEKIFEALPGQGIVRKCSVTFSPKTSAFVCNPRAGARIQEKTKNLGG